MFCRARPVPGSVSVVMVAPPPPLRPPRPHPPPLPEGGRPPGAARHFPPQPAGIWRRLRPRGPAKRRGPAPAGGQGWAWPRAVQARPGPAPWIARRAAQPPAWEGRRRNAWVRRHLRWVSLAGPVPGHGRSPPFRGRAPGRARALGREWCSRHPHLRPRSRHPSLPAVQWPQSLWAAGPCPCLCPFLCPSLCGQAVGACGILPLPPPGEASGRCLLRLQASCALVRVHPSHPPRPPPHERRRLHTPRHCCCLAHRRYAPPPATSPSAAAAARCRLQGHPRSGLAATTGRRGCPRDLGLRAG